MKRLACTLAVVVFGELPGQTTALRETITKVSPYEEPVQRKARLRERLRWRGPLLISPNKQRAGYVVAVDGKEDIRINGKSMATVDRVLQLIVTNDRYAAVVRHQDAYALLVDGLLKVWPRELRFFDFEAGRFCLSDSRGMFMEQPGETKRSGTPAFFSVDPNPALSPLVLRSGDGLPRVRIVKHGDTWRVYRDKKPGPHYREVHQARLSSDGTCLACLVKTADGRRALVIDGKEQGVVGRHQTGLRVSSSGALVVYRAALGAKWAYVVNGKADKAHDNLSRPIFSPDGRRLAYAGLDGDVADIVVDGEAVYKDRETDRNWRLPRLKFSPDSRRWLYVARSDRRNKLIVDGQVVGIYRELREPMFSPDSTKVAYLAFRRGAWALYEDGEPLKKVPGALDTAIGLGGGGRKYGLDPLGDPLRTGMLMVASCPLEGLAYSPDSSCLAYLIRKDGNWHVAVHGVAVSRTALKHVVGLPRLTFVDKHRLHLAALRSHEEGWIRLEVRILSKNDESKKR